MESALVQTYANVLMDTLGNFVNYAYVNQTAIMAESVTKEINADVGKDLKAITVKFVSTVSYYKCPTIFNVYNNSLAVCVIPCMNGGTCTGSNSCSCSLGFIGKYCQIGTCVPKCLNGGKCIMHNRCSCRRGWRGSNCQTRK